MQFSHFRVKLYPKSMQLPINHMPKNMLIDISGELHEKGRYDHLSRSLIQATLTTFIFV